MNTSTLIQNQLLATKFFVPVASGTLIPRPRLTALLQESLKYPFTLISAPAGFGKTTLLATWKHSLPASHPKFAWISLDEEDNDPQLFWTYVLAALQMHQAERFTSLLTQLQSAQAPHLKSILTTLINLLAESGEQFLLIVDDYQAITKQEVHTSLFYLVEHLPAQLRIILATRTDPPLPLSHLRARHQMQEIRTNQLRCTAEETRDFFKEVMHIQIPEETIQEVTTRTEGWLVGLQLLGLSLPEQANPATLLAEASGDQRYILDYLTQEVLGRQSQEVQMFLLSTCILERLTASLCDALTQEHNSHQMLRQLEQANLFVVSLDSKREWYRYHALFAQTLRSRLERTQGNLILTLHHRASLWYAEQGQITEAILHAFRAQEWQWAADLIERQSLQLISLTWGAGQRALVMLQEWIEQLPAEVIYSRPRLCLACTQLLWTVAHHNKLDAWLDAAEANLTAPLRTLTSANTPYSTLSPEARREQENRLGEVITFRAVVRSHEENAQAALPLCQQAHSLLSANNVGAHTFVSLAQMRALYASIANDAVAAIESGLQCGSRNQAAGKNTLAIGAIGATVMYMIGAGRLHEVYRLTQQARQLGTQLGGAVLPDVCWSGAWQAEVLREWNQLDTALEVIEEAISQSSRTATIISMTYSVFGYVVLIRISLSRGDLDTARSALQQFERISMSLNQPLSVYYRCLFTTIDQIRLWLACEELDRAMRWAEELDIRERRGPPLAREREDVAQARIFLATARPTLALQRLEPAIQRAITGQRWGHVIEIRLLQALAYQMCNQETQALETLSAAIRLAEPEGYIRSFVDEGLPMAALLSRLHQEQCKQGPTPYLDTVLAAFSQPSKAQPGSFFPPQSKAQPEPLSRRELEVLQLLARGASNQEIAQELVITVDTTKRHLSHIFAKLGVQNRFHAVLRARELSLLGEDP